MNRYHPFIHLLEVRIKLFAREPEAVFWTYGFPLIMIVGLGIAFRNKAPDRFEVDVVADSGSATLADRISDNDEFLVAVHSTSAAMERLRMGKTAVVVMVGLDGSCEYRFDPTRPESKMARQLLDDYLQRSAGRADAIAVVDREVTERGSRYIDFLVPGLIGMNIMGGGMWGIGYVLVDMRVKNLLRRLLAAPMRRRDFLLSMVAGRSLFFVPEMLFLLLAAYLIFDVPIRGNILIILLIAFIGALSFAGLGLLTACRAQRLETVSGLMNVIMMPMWLMSGIFFSSQRFPDFLQPFIQALPLTQLNNALRAVILEGASFTSQAVPVAVLAVWGVLCFALALKWFRWT